MLKEYPGTEVQTGTRSSERGDEEQDRPGRWLDVAGGAAGVWIWNGKEAGLGSLWFGIVVIYSTPAVRHPNRDAFKQSCSERLIRWHSLDMVFTERRKTKRLPFTEISLSAAAVKQLLELANNITFPGAAEERQDVGIL
ncbi:hypothetical protein NQZ68_005839 [Dissostichus eleginoides]|nr:hypothetical protein NQZ68_005839 [Dissostichus eleginoides]